MKTKSMKWLCLVLCLFACVSVSAQEKCEKLLGVWSTSTPEAPHGYQDGTCEFKEKGGKLTAQVKINGGELTISEIKKGEENRSYRCSFYLDGAAVDLRFKQTSDKLMEGIVDTQGMSIPVRFEKK